MIESMKMTLSVRFLSVILVFLSTAWGNQYQEYYQQHMKKPANQHNQQQYHPSQQYQAQAIGPSHYTNNWPPSPGGPASYSLTPLNSKAPSASNSYTKNQSAPSPHVNLHDQPHKHGSHMHQPHQHHHGVGARVNPDSEDVFSRPYCAVRPGGQCCPGRDDTCTMPILDTYCYCDVFCNRTVSDCCPDFWHWCIGIAAPDGSMGHGHLPLTKKKAIVNNCKFDGKYLSPDSTIRINCNNCTCVESIATAEYNWKCTQKVCLIRHELMDHVKKGNFGWAPTNYTFFWGMTLTEGVQHKLGTKRPMKNVKKMASMHVNINEVLPEQFNAREEWGDLIHPIQDQGNCGASWAFSTTSVAADRLSLHSGGIVREFLSPQHLLSCNKDHMQKGCDGGHLDRAWWFMRQTGVVDSECYPYRSGVTSESGMCMVPHYKTAAQRVKCPTKSARTSLIYQAAPPYRIAPHEREIMKEILENGPVQATMEVKEDFFMYKGGVYRYSLPANILPPNHRTTGFHSIRILGWGTEMVGGKPLPYWLCANSWGTKWGEDGHFRIVRGTDECKIESFVVGVWGKINGRPIIKSANGKIGSTEKSKKLKTYSKKKPS